MPRTAPGSGVCTVPAGAVCDHQSTGRLDFAGTWGFTGPTMTNLSASQLHRAAGIKRKIESLQKKLARLLVGTDGAVTLRKRRKMSAAGRRKIAAAARARWAKVKGRKSAAKPVKKARRKMSAASRAKIAAAARARWKKAKAAGKKTL
jgi:hypothetical protein